MYAVRDNASRSRCMDATEKRTRAQLLSYTIWELHTYTEPVCHSFDAAFGLVCFDDSRPASRHHERDSLELTEVYVQDASRFFLLDFWEKKKTQDSASFAPDDPCPCLGAPALATLRHCLTSKEA